MYYLNPKGNLRNSKKIIIFIHLFSFIFLNQQNIVNLCFLFLRVSKCISPFRFSFPCLASLQLIFLCLPLPHLTSPPIISSAPRITEVSHQKLKKTVNKTCISQSVEKCTRAFVSGVLWVCRRKGILVLFLCNKVFHY